MPRIRQSLPTPNPSHPTDAWRAAEAAGVDMSLLEHSLRLSAWERLVEHQRALELVEMLENAKVKLPNSITVRQLQAIKDRTSLT
jgi:hypothetical protein